MITKSLGINEKKALGKIAHYQLVKKIGQGGMSAVYEAFDERLKRPIAIKLLHPFLAEMPEYRARFFREAEACARLAHPNILQIFDVSSPESSPELYIVTELLSGGNLKERAKELNAFLLPELGAMIIAQVAQALEHAHQKEIIHRDIKPENIMLTSEGQIKLMDFGIASIGTEENLTQSGTLMGSLAHLAPEVILGHKATRQSDIFSLATVFYWLLTNKLPFNADSPHALLKAIVDSPAERPQRLSPYLSDNLATIIERGMKKDPLARFSSANEFASAIESALLSLGMTTDTRKLTAVLSHPDKEIDCFKENLLSQMTRQLQIYESQGQNQEALIVKCRLEADTFASSPKKTSKKNYRFVIAVALSLVSCFAIVGALVLKDRLLTNNNNFHAQKPVPINPEPLFRDEPIKTLDASAPAPVLAKKEEIVPTEDQIIQDLNIIIWPFANVIVDGKLRAKNTKKVRLSLSPGLHRVAFTHEYAATIEKTLKIDAVKKPDDLLIKMIKSKPAFLVIKSNIDADVAINGNFKGSSLKSIQYPIVIPMPDKTHSMTQEVIIQQEGYEPLVLDTEFIAGQTKILSVKLISLGGAKVEH